MRCSRGGPGNGDNDGIELIIAVVFVGEFDNTARIAGEDGEEVNDDVASEASEQYATCDAKECTTHSTSFDKRCRVCWTSSAP